MRNTAVEIECRQIALGLLCREDRILVARRPPGRHLAGFHEFPGGKLHSDESALCALQREFAEEVAVKVCRARLWLRFCHLYPGFRLDLHVFQITDFVGEPRAQERQNLYWIPLEQLDTLKFPPANRPILCALRLKTAHSGRDDPDVLDRNIKEN